MSVKHDHIETLRAALERQCEDLTDTLALLTAHSTTPDRLGYDRHGIAVQLANTRQALADTAQALQRMAQGTYGRCERCQTDIPMERLEIRPHARYCVPCQQAAVS